jgi:peptide/nickel transport system permease protein
MLAAKCSGLSTAKKIFKHLLPNIIPQLIVSMTLGLGSVILMEATLGYLGIGAPLGTATWGNMINLASQSRYRNYYPNLWLGSGICITLAILAFNFVGDGLRDAFDPKMKR